LSEKFSEMKIERATFPIRTFNAMMRAKIYYVSQLITTHPGKLALLPNCGQGTLNEIRQFLSLHGVDWFAMHHYPRIKNPPL